MVNGWNSSNERLCKSVGERAAGLIVMHNMSEHYYKKERTKYTKLLNFLTIGTAIISAIDSFYPNTNLQIAIKILTIATAFSVKYYTNSNIEGYTKAHKKIYGEYLSLYNRILSTLNRNREIRPEGEKFTHEITEEFNKLNIDSITIPEAIVEKFKKENIDKDIAKPIITGEIDKISIYKRHRTDNEGDSRSSGSPVGVNVQMDRRRSYRNIMMRTFRMGKNNDVDDGLGLELGNVLSHHPSMPPEIQNPRIGDTPIDHVNRSIISDNVQYIENTNQRPRRFLPVNVPDMEDQSSNIEQAVRAANLELELEEET